MALIQYYNDYFNNMCMLHFLLILHHYDVAPSISIILVDMMFHPLLQ
jgi:hypothetical protein